MKNFFKLPALLFLFIFAFNFAHADVKLPAVLSSDMVLQRDSEIKIWGWADSREKVTVIFNGQKEKIRADKDGNWMVVFPPLDAGGPYSITIKGKNELILENILIGDVWICSGQSNMEWPVERSNNPEEEIMNADYPEIRLLNIEHNLQLSEVNDVPDTEWMVCKPQNIKDFSAVGYFFGRFIHRETDVPVGLISTNWGGTNIEAWTSRDYITRYEEFRERLDNLVVKPEEELKKEREEFLSKLISDFKLNIKNPDKENWSSEPVDLSLWKKAEVPGLWEDNYLPGVDGTVWYRRVFTLPAELEGSEAKVYLGKIDDSDITWVNGVKIGEISDQHDKDRVYNVPADILKAGENILTVRVEDYGGGGGFWSGSSVLRIVAGDYEENLAGDWLYKLTAEGFDYNSNPLGLRPNSVPASLYNGMIHPLLNLTVKGAIWYQGEANASRACQYRELMPLMIECWRDKWQQDDMPFIMVQLANFREPVKEPAASDWAELREAQLMTIDKLDNVGIAVIIDIGEADDIHPRNKQDVGYRLGLNALKIAYDRDLVFQGPLFKSVSFENDKATLDFSHTGSGLMIKDKYGYLKSFSIAGEDRVFHWAKARLEGNRIVVYSDDVKNPVAVRYAWADNPHDANLYNKEGLPASPFRTDNWPLSTCNE